MGLTDPPLCTSNDNEIFYTPMISYDSHKNTTLTKKNKSKIDKLSILSLNCCSVRSQSRRALLQSIMEEHQAI